MSVFRASMVALAIAGTVMCGLAPSTLDAGAEFSGGAAADSEFDSPDVVGSERPWSSGIFKDLRRHVRAVFWQLGYAARTWWPYALRAIAFLMLAAAIGILDRNLLGAWREDGLRALSDYVPFMLYVYTALFFDRRIARLGKAFLVFAVAYGAVRGDLFPDRSVETLLDDVFLVAVAARIFVATCPEPLVLELARNAIGWKQRMRTLKRFG